MNIFTSWERLNTSKDHFTFLLDHNSLEILDEVYVFKTFYGTKSFLPQFPSFHIWGIAMNIIEFLSSLLFIWQCKCIY